MKTVHRFQIACRMAGMCAPGHMFNILIVTPTGRAFIFDSFIPSRELAIALAEFGDVLADPGAEHFGETCNSF